MDDLRRRFRDGDPDAVGELFRRHGGAVHTVARSIAGEQLAGDVVQQTFVKAWRAAATFAPDRELAPWLYAIARRTAIDALRRERRPTAGDHLPLDDRPIAATEEPPSLERSWETFEVRRALDELPPDEREVVRRAHLLGFTHVEIAQQLGVPVGTVKSRSARAHRRLAAALAHLLDDGANRITRP